MQQFLKSIGIALQNIRANPLHTFLSTLGIIIGVASLVGILTLADGLEETGRSQLSSTTSLNNLSISSRSSKTINKVRVPIENRARIQLSDVWELIEKYEERAIIELVSTRNTEVAYGDSLTGMYLQGNLYFGLEFVQDTVQFGRYLEESDIRQDRKVAVLTHEVIKNLGLNAKESIGKTLEIQGENFEVIGVFGESLGNVPKAFIPISIFMELGDSYPSINMKVKNAEEIPIIEEEMTEWLDANFEEGSEAFQMFSNEARIEQFSQGILVFKLVMGAITGISVLVGGIGVMNVLLISVTERTKEIGIRKATGAKRKDIILQFMAESITISFVGSILGWILGIIGLLIFVPIVNSFANFGFSISISTGTVLTILVIALIIGVVFGTYPAWRASQLDPIDAIRHE